MVLRYLISWLYSVETQPVLDIVDVTSINVIDGVVKG